LEKQNKRAYPARQILEQVIQFRQIPEWNDACLVKNASKRRTNQPTSSQSWRSLCIHKPIPIPRPNTHLMRGSEPMDLTNSLGLMRSSVLFPAYANVYVSLHLIAWDRWDWVLAPRQVRLDVRFSASDGDG
jgi:hypothetical protein